ncbi:MAG: DASS family sodium-coupled anion symporter [Sulfurovum sp.]|nr:DASS family sodium-coupled anion symporter [Sulfurovum sp.]MDD3602061.1 DASS family sodium-coupled anion symporter [Sulfurovum sp.]
MRGIIVAITIAVICFAASLALFSLQHAIIFGVIALLVVLWTNEALPLGVVSLLPIILFPFFGIMDSGMVANNYANPIIFLFIGGFMMAIAIEKTQLHIYFSSRLLRIFPKTPQGILYALSITSALLSSVLSNTTVALMLMPIALFLSENVQLKIRFLLATAYGASIGGVLTPIGTPPNLILMGFLQEHSLPALSFGKWMFLLFPAVSVMLLLVPWILSWEIKKESVEHIKHSADALTFVQKRLYKVIVMLALILAGNTFAKEWWGAALDETLILLGFGLFMFVPKIGFLKWEDTKKIPYEIIFLFGAGFSIAAAFSFTGLAADIARKLEFVLTFPFFWILVFVALFITFATEVTSNTALTSISLPIFYEFSKHMPQEDAMVLLMVVTIKASYAFMLPIATPPNAIIMSSGIVSVKQMAKMGIKFNAIGIVVICLSAYFIWRGMI